MPRIEHFEIKANNPERIIDFYNKVFSWEFSKWDGPFDYWNIITGDEKEPGINGGLMKQKDHDKMIEILDAYRKLLRG